MSFPASMRIAFVVGTLTLAAVCQQAPMSMIGPQRVDTTTRAYPRVDLGGRQLEYMGAFAADGKFKRVSKFGRAMDALISASVPYDPSVEATPEDLSPLRPCLALDEARDSAVRSNARVVEDFQPPAHAVGRVQGHSVFHNIGDLVLHLASGTERIVCTPYAVTTDSQQRVIITDPAEHAVHVLDYEGNNSFHIFGGEERRLQSPAGVAVDAEDNIYVADSERGMVLVYDRNGRFLRYIGEYKGESMYQQPTGIAIDRRNGRLYVLDTALHQLYINDLQGHMLARIGKRGGGRGPGELTRPTAVAVHGDELMIVDSNGSRLQIFDTHGNFRKQFSIQSAATRHSVNVPPYDTQPAAYSGLCVDSAGYIYMSDRNRGSVRVYDDDGHLLGSFGRHGRRPGEFEQLAGIWADGDDRLYVADASRLSLQVFQFEPGQPDAGDANSAPASLVGKSN